MQLDQLLHIADVGTAEEEKQEIQGVMNVVQIMEDLKHTDLMYKLSAISGDFIQRLNNKVNSIKLLEVEDEEVDTHFDETEKSFIYGCYLISSQVDAAPNTEEG